MDVGTTLRTARQRRDLSIEQIAATTKIPVNVLHAIEENDFERVPRGIFARGFIRAYAREVDLDPEEIVGQFLEETGDTIPTLAAAQAAELAVDDEEIEDRRFDPRSSASGPGWAYALIVAALLVAVVSVNRSNGPEPPDDTGVIATVPAELDGTAAAPAVQPAAASVEELQPVATAGAGLRFDLEVQGPCWVEAVVDGRKLVYRLMQPGERETIDVTHEMILRVGDPGALTYSVNGRPGEALGRPGIPVTVRFTTEDGEVQLVS